MLKIGHFICGGKLYGAERWMLAFMNHLKNVDSVFIYPTLSDPVMVNEVQKLGIKICRVNEKRKKAFLDFIKKIFNIIKKEEIDILHTHGYKADILGFFAARMAGIKIMSTPHGFSHNAGLKMIINDTSNKIILNFFDLIVPVSSDLGNSILYKKKIKQLHNFVDLTTIPQPQEGNPKLVTYIGQLIKRKRVQDLILALKHVKTPGVRVQVIGDGAAKNELMALAASLGFEDRIAFLGFRSDRLELLNSSGIFALVSTLEGIPRCMMEAMALKRTVIGTDIPGITDLISPHETGLLVPIGAPEKIAGAIDFLIDEEEKRKLMAENAGRLIQEHFSAQKVAEKFEKIYESLARR